MMAMYCGPIRHRMSEPAEAQLLHRELVVHDTAHTALPGEHIQVVFRELVANASRTRWICEDIAASANEGRNNLVLTRWTEHLDAIYQELTRRGLAPLVLRGGMGKKARQAVLDQLSQPQRRARSSSQQQASSARASTVRRSIDVPGESARPPLQRSDLDLSGGGDGT